MCFDLDSAPPIPVIAGAAVAHDDLLLHAADGNAFSAFLAEPEGEPRAAVVILPDVRGLYRFYEELALRFAERGYAALAIDYFGRTAGTGKRGDDFEFAPHVEATTDHGVQADVGAAIEHLRGLGSQAVVTVGFCFGGRASWVAAASGHGLAGAVGFYGSPTRQREGQSPVERAADVACPILALQAGDDQGISAADNETFDRVLTEAGVEHEIVTFADAPHSFFDRKQSDFAAASADAWQRTLAFVDRHARLS